MAEIAQGEWDAEGLKVGVVTGRSISKSLKSSSKAPS